VPARLGIWRIAALKISVEERFGASHALKTDGSTSYQEIDRSRIKENDMLGLGLVGTIIVIVLVIWIIRRV